MKKVTEVIPIASEEDIPGLEFIISIPRHKALKLVFYESMNGQRKDIGERLEKELNGFLVATHTINPEINIYKLITPEEIDTHQLFFEQCAIDYRVLATELIMIIIQKHKIDISKSSILQVFQRFIRQGRRLKGKINEWEYYFHGHHLGFWNKQSNQKIEVCLTNGLEFGGLDPYFFLQYINSTASYQPLPVDIYEEYHDGVLIIERMKALGKIELLPGKVNHPVAVKGKIEALPLPIPDRSKFSFLNLFKRKHTTS